ncbi:acyl--CoA ligase [Sneathiella marina]|uniref:Acyl--CoA ligase n=1 Tax=Sneathiella marina TaxID=2950108 RepID=A0ABY4WA92_9PROT|nr:class I adenylate-forming enzyme family protein [Sneathiella marina]USG62665.1 acyl--CoA ligase [Sneathiella marina]
MPFAGPDLSTPVQLSTLLQAGVDATPDDVAIVSAEMSWTWRELQSVVDNVAANLVLKGLRTGDRLACLMPNRTHLLILYLASFKAGFVLVPLNYRYTPSEIDYALNVSGASLLVYHSERETDIAASNSVPDLPLGLIPYRPLKDTDAGFEDLYSEPDSAVVFDKFDKTDPAAIFFTSGSTGKPKGVTHSHQSLGWMFAAVVGACGLTANDVLLPGSSMSHLGGFMFSFAALSEGGRVVIARVYDATEILPLMRQEKPTVLCMLPATLMGLVRDKSAKEEDFKSIRLCRCGSDKVPEELEIEFEALTGYKVDEGYGMSEVGLAALNPPEGLIKMGSIGTANPGYEMSIRDDQGVEVMNGTIGNLWMKTPSLMTGYWNNPEETDNTVHDGWIDSGDIMRADEQDYLWFCGRKKQIIVHDGSNIFPQEVEEALMAHDAVSAAGVIGLHDLVHGENVRAYVVLRPDHALPSALELIEFARTRIGYKAPEEIIFLSEMPINPTGKIDRVRLKTMAAAHH